MAQGRKTRRQASDGATLILALIFLLVVSLVVIGVERWTGNNLANTSKFVSAQSLQSEADSANNLAIQFVRYTFLGSSLDGEIPTSCWTTGSGTTSQYPPIGETFPGPSVSPVDAWCMTRWYTSDSVRVVTVSTCLSTVSPATCESQPLLQTIVTITDDEAGCAPLAPASKVSDTTCGTTMVLSDWQFGAVPPSVSSVADAPGGLFSCATGTPVVITGANLDLATNADFIDSTSAGTSSPVLAAGKVVSSTDTAVDACTPASLSAPLNVLVSTPMGTSGYATQWTG